MANESFAERVRSQISWIGVALNTLDADGDGDAHAAERELAGVIAKLSQIAADLDGHDIPAGVAERKAATRVIGAVAGVSNARPTFTANELTLLARVAAPYEGPAHMVSDALELLSKEFRCVAFALESVTDINPDDLARVLHSYSGRIEVLAEVAHAQTIQAAAANRAIAEDADGEHEDCLDAAAEE